MIEADKGKVIIDGATQIGDVAWRSIDNLIVSVVERLPYILAGFLVLALFWLFSRVLKSLFWAASKRTKLDTRLRILFSRLIVVFVVTIGIFTAFSVIIPSFGFGDLIAGLGLTSFVIGFATKDILNNLLSGVLILWQQPFRIGDHIFIGSNAGKVEYIGIRATSLRKDDGELILIPNGDMYSSALTIRGAGAQRRMNLKFKVDFAADLSKVRQLTCDQLQQTPGIVRSPQPRVVVTDLTNEGVAVTANFWIDTNESKPLEVFDAAAANVLRTLQKGGIELFPPEGHRQQPKQEESDEQADEEEIAEKKRRAAKNDL